MAISPLSFNIFIHALQVSSSSGDSDCNRNVLSSVFLSSCNLVIFVEVILKGSRYQVVIDVYSFHIF
jgi:hypothetical protein